jgi:hypothetical protein
MFLNGLLAEQCQVVAGIIPIDFETGANNGDWVDMALFDRCTVIIYKAAGTAGDDPVITMKQATDVTGGTNKALNFTRIDAKVGTQTATGAFTTVTQAAGNTYTDTVSAEAQALWLIEFQASDLDVNGGYTCLQVSVPDTGSAGAEIGTALYILRGARFGGAGLPSAIV